MGDMVDVLRLLPAIGELVNSASKEVVVRTVVVTSCFENLAYLV